MQLVQDKELKEEAEQFYGTYIGTFLSDRGQVRADLFDNGSDVNAYVSFPTGLNPTNVEDRYVGLLREYATGHGFADRFHFIYSDS